MTYVHFFSLKNSGKIANSKNATLEKKFFAEGHEGSICPMGADVFVSLIFGFLGQEIFDPKT